MIPKLYNWYTVSEAVAAFGVEGTPQVIMRRAVYRPPGRHSLLCHRRNIRRRIACLLPVLLRMAAAAAQLRACRQVALAARRGS